MSVQSASAIVSLMAILALAAVFLRVRMLAHEARDYTPVRSHAYRIRSIFFAALVIVGLPVTVWLLRAMPYDVAAAQPQIVNATAAQWYWDLDRTEVTAGRAVEFRVTASDVNHGFGIYSEDGQLVAQTQAMPGYINRLVHTFEKPGTYEVLCLEYCGVAHHAMIAEITVTEAGDSDG